MSRMCSALFAKSARLFSCCVGFIVANILNGIRLAGVINHHRIRRVAQIQLFARKRILTFLPHSLLALRSGFTLCLFALLRLFESSSVCFLNAGDLFLDRQWNLACVHFRLLFGLLVLLCLTNRKANRNIDARCGGVSTVGGKGGDHGDVLGCRFGTACK